MESIDDIAVAKIEARIRLDRDQEPCEDHEPTSKLIELCSFCGWTKQAHEEAKSVRS